MRIIDSNTHIEKEPTSIRVSEINSWYANTAEGSVTHYATVQDILAGMKKHNIEKSLVLPNSITPDKKDARKTSHMISREIKGFDNLIGGALVHPYSHNAVEELEEAVLELGLSVLMLSPDKQGFELSDESLWILFERVEEMEVPVFLYAQWEKGLKDYFNKEDLYDIISSFHIPFLLAHMGVGDDVTMVTPLSDLKNIFLETSHITPKEIHHAIEVFGSDRVIFGSDFSYNLYPAFELEKILDMELGKKDKEKVLGKNLANLLK